jgi:hypothetical protein
LTEENFCTIPLLGFFAELSRIVARSGSLSQVTGIAIGQRSNYKHDLIGSLWPKFLVLAAWADSVRACFACSLWMTSRVQANGDTR